MFKKKAKVVLKEKTIGDSGLVFMSKDNGDVNVCVTMATAYLADMISSGQANMKEVTDILKKLVKDYKEEGENGKWL